MDSHVIDNYHLLSYDVIDSTNEEAKRLAYAGGQHGAVIWAKSQEHGKGRMGREWLSEEGNLFCSLLLKPDVAADSFSQLSFVASLSAYHALSDILMPSHNLSLKWPNDILLDKRKLGGILLEMITDERGESWVILGLGINVEHFPNNTSYLATSLKDSGIEIISAKIVLSRFLNCFLPLYDNWIDKGFSTIRQNWMQHAAFRNEIISLTQDDTVHSGVFEGIDACGLCLIRDDSGDRKAFAAGDVSLRSAHAFSD